MQEHIRTLSNELGFDKTLSSSLSLSPKVARRDTSIQATVPHKRILAELIDSSEKGNIDDKSLSKEILSILEQKINEEELEDIKKQSCIYEMYVPFIRGHYKEPMDIPKTKLFLWMKKVLLILLIDFEVIFLLIVGKSLDPMVKQFFFYL